jgi:hypothetical protein
VGLPRLASRRSASVCHNRGRCRPDASVDFICISESASVFQRRVKCHPEAHLLHIWRDFAASGHWTSVFQHRDLWHLEAFLGMIWNFESSHSRRRFSSVVSDRIPRLVYAKYGVMSASRRLASRRCSSVFQHCAISLPEAFLGLVLCSESVSRREASRRSESVFQRRVLWLP